MEESIDDGSIFYFTEIFFFNWFYLGSQSKPADVREEDDDDDDYDDHRM